MPKQKRRKKLLLAARLFCRYNKLPVLSKTARHRIMCQSERCSPSFKYGSAVGPLSSAVARNCALEYGGEISDSDDEKMDYIVYPSAPSDRDVAVSTASFGCCNTHTYGQSSSAAATCSTSRRKREQEEASRRFCPHKGNEPISIDSENDSVNFVGTFKTRPRVCARLLPRKQDLRGTIEKTELVMHSNNRNEKTNRIFDINAASGGCPNYNFPDCRENVDCIVVDSPKCGGSEMFMAQSNEKSKNLVENGATNGTDDEDLVIVSSSHNCDQNIDLQMLKRIVSIIVRNYLEEMNVKKVSTRYVLSRLKSLHHKDFSDRFSEVDYCTRRALKRFRQTEKLEAFREVRPGVRLIDIDTLSSDNWVNDVIINQYMKLLLTGYPAFGTLSSFWHDTLLKGKEPKLPNGWEKQRYILVPTCADSHWSLLCFSPRSYSVVIYSSLSTSTTELERAETLLNFFISKARGHPKATGIKLPGSSLPRQKNGHDCGVYVCMFARCIVRGNSFFIDPWQVCEFREWLKKEILDGRLFDVRDDIYGDEYTYEEE